MAYRAVERSQWRSFCDNVSKTAVGGQVEIEVAGIDIGDQIEAEWLPFNGVSYDPHDDSLHVLMQNGEMLDHTISAPREVHVGVAPEGLSDLVVIDGQGRKQFIRFRQPLRLPADA